METAIHDLELVVILLLVFVIGFGWIAARVKAPYPILLVIGGLILSLVPGIPTFRLDPNFVFLGVLPPLVFSAAFTTSWRDFRYNLVSIMLLAFGLVGFTVVGVALLSKWLLPGFNWPLGLVLGAVVSTTDAIAATSIAGRVGLPKRIIHILEGESLINDATGLLALEFTVALVNTGQTPSALHETGRLLYLIVAGMGVGLIFAVVINWLEHRIDDSPIEITLSIVTPYAAYLAAEAIRGSGVLAAVACGLYLGRRSVTFFSSVVRIEAQAFWNTLTFILNGVVFILIGFQLPYVLDQIHAFSRMEVILWGAAISVAVIVLRLVWTFPATHVAYVIRRRLLHQNEKNPSGRRVFIVGWTGMRGAVALAAALSLPAGFPMRDLILFLTFCVIFVTLVLQGLTLPAVIRRLGVAEPEGKPCEELDARKIMMEAALERLAEFRDCDNSDLQSVCEDVANHYRLRLENLGLNGNAEPLRARQQDLFESLTTELRNAERSAAVQLRDQDRIGDEVLRTLLRELDLLDARRAEH